MFDHDVDSQPTKTKDPGGRPRSLLSVRFPEVSAPAFIAMLIVLIGIVIGATVLGLDIPNQMTAQSERFYKVADEAFLKFVSALENYKVSGIWLHEACQNRKMSFKEFRGVYEHITSTGLEFQGISCALNVTSSERPFYENQTRAYLAGNYPTASYAGFMGCRPATEEGDCQIGRRRNASYYLVTHFVEPLEDFWNLVTLDFDMMTTWHQRKIIFQALETNSLSVTERLQYLPPPDDESDAYQYSLMMVHPGIPHKRNDSLQLRPSEDIAIVVVRFVALLLKAHQKYKVDEETMIYVYDSTKSVIDEKGQPLFLGGAKIGKGNLTITPEISFTDLQQADINLREDKVLSIAERQWTFVAVAPQGAYEPEYFLIVFGALMIVVASTCAALWIYSISKARAEKTAILLESAEKAAKSERELNDFIAHE
jgi:CHASE1-domain containing sensor protein